MSEEELIIATYCVLDEMLKNFLENAKLRAREPNPALTDGEVIMLLIIEKYLGLRSDKKIWTYFNVSSV